MSNLKIFRCEHCLKIRQKEIYFVIMTTPTNNLLPVEVEKDELVDEDEIYNKHKRISHLTNCKERSLDWNDKRRKFEKNDSLRIAPVIETCNKTSYQSRILSDEEKDKIEKEKKFKQILESESKGKKCTQNHL